MHLAASSPWFEGKQGGTGGRVGLAGRGVGEALLLGWPLPNSQRVGGSGEGEGRALGGTIWDPEVPPPCRCPRSHSRPSATHTRHHQVPRVIATMALPTPEPQRPLLQSGQSKSGFWRIP